MFTTRATRLLQRHADDVSNAVALVRRQGDVDAQSVVDNGGGQDALLVQTHDTVVQLNLAVAHT